MYYYIFVAINFPGGKRNLKINEYKSPAQNSNIEGHNTKNKLKVQTKFINVSLLA